MERRPFFLNVVLPCSVAHVEMQLQNLGRRRWHYLLKGILRLRDAHNWKPLWTVMVSFSEISMTHLCSALERKVGSNLCHSSNVQRVFFRAVMSRRLFLLCARSFLPLVVQWSVFACFLRCDIMLLVPSSSFAAHVHKVFSV